MTSLENNDFIPECYIDTNLVETLLNIVPHPAKGVNHQHGCNEVCRKMSGKYENQFAVGIIDNDKQKPSYVNDCEEICHSEHLILLKHRNRPHFLIVISPAMEKFILSCAQEEKVNLSEYGLSNDLEGLKKQTKNVTSKKDVRFISVFRAMQNAKEMKILSNILNHLKENKYQCSVDFLKSCFE